MNHFSQQAPNGKRKSGKPDFRLVIFFSFHAVSAPLARPECYDLPKMMGHAVSKAGILLSAYPGVVKQGAFDIP